MNKICLVLNTLILVGCGVMNTGSELHPKMENTPTDKSSSANILEKITSVKEALKDDSWTVGQGEHEGLPLLVRVRFVLTPELDKNDYTTLIRVFWEYPDAGHGFPNESSIDEMEVFENRAVEALESKSVAILAAVITNGGVREWVWYTHSADMFGESLGGMPHENGAYPIQITAEDDPEWVYFFDSLVSQ